MGHLSFRIPDRTIARLDALATERGVTRSRLVRGAIDAVIADGNLPPVETPGEDELLALLAEKARQGNVAAIRSLLIRIEERDPRARAIAELELLAQARRQ